MQLAVRNREARPKKRVGRPRASGRAPTGDTREEILKAAAKLFAERGVIGTSTKQIAAASGLRQSAIFHWFPSKEAILESLFSKGWDRSLEYFERLSQSDLPGSVKLCMSLTYDARLVAGAEPYIQVMIVPPELRQPKFKRLLQKRQRLIAHLERFIEQAVTEGDFRSVAPSAAARMVLAVDEVVLDAAKIQSPSLPQDHAAHVVDFALHALVKDHSRIPVILHAVERQTKMDVAAPAA